MFVRVKDGDSAEKNDSWRMCVDYRDINTDGEGFVSTTAHRRNLADIGRIPLQCLAGSPNGVPPGESRPRGSLQSSVRNTLGPVNLQRHAIWFL